MNSSVNQFQVLLILCPFHLHAIVCALHGTKECIRYTYVPCKLIEIKKNCTDSIKQLYTTHYSYLPLCIILRYYLNTTVHLTLPVNYTVF